MAANSARPSEAKVLFSMLQIFFCEVSVTVSDLGSTLLTAPLKHSIQCVHTSELLVY